MTPLSTPRVTTLQVFGRLEKFVKIVRFNVEIQILEFGRDLMLPRGVTNEKRYGHMDCRRVLQTMNGLPWGVTNEK